MSRLVLGNDMAHALKLHSVCTRSSDVSCILDFRGVDSNSCQVQHCVEMNHSKDVI